MTIKALTVPGNWYRRLATRELIDEIHLIVIELS